MYILYFKYICIVPSTLYSVIRIITTISQIGTRTKLRIGTKPVINGWRLLSTSRKIITIQNAIRESEKNILSSLSESAVQQTDIYIHALESMNTTQTVVARKTPVR